MKSQCQASSAHTLTQGLKEVRASVCADLLHEAQNNFTFVNSIIAEDESLCFQYDSDEEAKHWMAVSRFASVKESEAPAIRNKDYW
jgi:hypothetical protein